MNAHSIGSTRAVSVVPLIPQTSVVFTNAEFKIDGRAMLKKSCDMEQLKPQPGDANTSYDLRVGGIYRDHRKGANGRTLRPEKTIKLRPGTAVIIQTEEWVELPTTMMGQILPKVTLLEKGVANTPSKIDPGYKGYLLITAFNHGRNMVKLKRFEKFCALYMLTVAEGVVPYDKPGKYVVGQPFRNWWQEVRDWARDNSPIIAVLSLLISVIVAIAGAGVHFKLW